MLFLYGGSYKSGCSGMLNNHFFKNHPPLIAN
nr:MAG TPA: hypothetical protein [Caudoviricetes sp.]